MFTVENLICSRYPGFAQQHRWLRSPLLAVLRLLFHESRFRQFAEDYPHLRGMDFVDQVLEYFDFSYAVTRPQLGRASIRRWAQANPPSKLTRSWSSTATA